MILKTFFVFFVTQFLTISVSLWLRYIDLYNLSIVMVVIPLIIISSAWPLYLRSNIFEVVNFQNTIKSFISALFGVILPNYIIYIIWYLFIKKGDFAMIWGKDFDFIKVQLSVHLIIFFIFYFLFMLVLGKKIVKLFQG